MLRHFIHLVKKSGFAVGFKGTSLAKIARPAKPSHHGALFSDNSVSKQKINSLFTIT